MVDRDLKGDGVSFLSIQVLQHGGDHDGCREEPHPALTLTIVTSELFKTIGIFDFFRLSRWSQKNI